MSTRARHSRGLATVLSAATGTPVVAQFDRRQGRYVLCWEAGPTILALSSRVREQIERYPTLRLDELLYLRTDSSTAHRPDGNWVANPVPAPNHLPVPVATESRLPKEHHGRCA